ncbi:MAG: DNA-directed RNA polymerase [Candidatus Thalassarchaeaceae archaeon]|nr:DNA-directed RNA polymerase [Candidatus Thalassarchaeaceae archaeon]
MDAAFFGENLRGKQAMYSLKQINDTIRIPAEYIKKGKSLSEHVDRLAHDAFEGRFDDDGNYILLTFDHELQGRGRIIHGDGAIYQKVSFKALLFNMESNEIVDGAVSEIHEFGAFVRIGPMEALLHKSQILDEQIDINIGQRQIEGKQSGKRLGEGTPVRARIVSLSLNPHDPRSSKIGLTCKQPSLGAHDWLDEERD